MCSLPWYCIWLCFLCDLWCNCCISCWYAPLGRRNIRASNIIHHNLCPGCPIGCGLLFYNVDRSVLVFFRYWIWWLRFRRSQFLFCLPHPLPSPSPFPHPTLRWFTIMLANFAGKVAICFFWNTINVLMTFMQCAHFCTVFYLNGCGCIDRFVI